MTDILPLEWTHPDGDTSVLRASTPSSDTGFLSLVLKGGLWQAQWDDQLAGGEDVEVLKAAGQSRHDAWLSRFLAPQLPSSPKDLAHRLKSAEKKISKQSRDLKAARRRVVDLEQRIEDAVEAVCETAPSYKHHLTAAMAALGRDFGDPDWEKPGQAKRSDALQAQVNAAEARLLGLDMLRGVMVACRDLGASAIEGQGSATDAVRDIHERLRVALSDLEDLDYPLVVTMAMRPLDWVFHQLEGQKFGYHEAVDTVYGMVQYRINQVREDGHSFLVGNSQFTEHSTVRDAKVHAEMMNREMLQKAVLPHIRVVPKHDIDVAPLRAGKACLAGADHRRALTGMNEAQLKQRLSQIEMLIVDILEGVEHAESGAEINEVGGAVAAQLHHAIYRHDLGAAHDFLMGGLGGQERWSVLDFDGNSQSEGWECRLLSRDGQVVTSAAGRVTPQTSAAHAMIVAALWAMSLETKQALGVTPTVMAS